MDSELKPIKDIFKSEPMRREKRIARDSFKDVFNKKDSIPSLVHDMIRDRIKIEHQRAGKEAEIMVLVLLAVDYFPITALTIGIGGEDMVQVAPDDAFNHILSREHNAKAFILGHNHPSGNLEMSDWDHMFMKDFQELGYKLNRPLKDFILLSDTSDEIYSHRNNTYEF